MNAPFTTVAALVVGYLGYSVTTDVSDIVDPPPRVLSLDVLQYNADDGTVTQSLSGGVKAHWTARIHRTVAGVSSVLCTGEGEKPGLYNGKVSTFTVDEWVGGDCPDLIDGDEGRAGWDYINENGVLVTVIGEFIVGQEVEVPEGL